MNITDPQIYIVILLFGISLFSWLSYSQGVKVGYAAKEREWQEYNARQRVRRRDIEEYKGSKRYSGAKTF